MPTEPDQTQPKDAETIREPVPRYRAYTGPAILSRGFRPFFLLAGVWAPMALGIFLSAFFGHIVLPSAMDAFAWHAHEMLFGFVAAAVAGFLLTAIPNWTGRLPLQGRPLLALVALWIAGRLAVAVSAWTGAWLAALVDLSFLAALVCVIVREIVAGRNWRNLPIVTAVLLLLVTNALSHAQTIGMLNQTGLAERCAIAVMAGLITLIGGRIVPSFTHNWLANKNAAKLSARSSAIDYFALALALLALARWALEPEGELTGLVAGLAAAANLVRLVRWRGWLTLSEPLVWVLHLGYLWIVIGLALIGVAATNDIVPASGAIHALTAGAMGTMTLAVMSRAALGHSGEALVAGVLLTLAFLLVTLAAMTRVGAAVWDDTTIELLMVSGAAWVAAFGCYLIALGPLMFCARR
jgi:uncharacterized protein involved in response to NO